MLQIEQTKYTYSFALDNVGEIISFYNELKIQQNHGYTIDAMTKNCDYTNSIDVTYIHESRKNV